MYRRINDPDNYEVCVFDGVNASGVYVGFMDKLQCITHSLGWRIDKEASEMCTIPYKTLTLAEIIDQVKGMGLGSHAIVIVNGPLSGTILEYGNHGDYWEQIGELVGYA